MNLSMLIRSARLGVRGAVAVELALAAPVFITVVLGAVDFGRLLMSTQSLAAGTRVGAEYARNSQTCQTGIQLLSSVQIAGACTTGIHQAMQNSLNFNPALTFPAPDVRLECYCDGDNARCDNANWMPANFSCATTGRVSIRYTSG
jgi:Flp pilus assembly protein TadG